MTSGNDYVLQVKGNQPTLLARLQALHGTPPAPAEAFHTHSERRRGWLSRWQTSVYTCIGADLRAAGAGLGRCVVVVVVVVKTVTYRSHMPERRHYYLTGLRTLSAAARTAGIRGHWGIKNTLHRPRPVQFDQDCNSIRHPVAVANLALLTTLALNHLLATFSQSVSYAQLYFAQNLRQFLQNTGS